LNSVAGHSKITIAKGGKLKRFEVIVSALSKTENQFDTLAEVNGWLENCQGRVSITDHEIGHEIFNDYVDGWLRKYGDL